MAACLARSVFLPAFQAQSVDCWFDTSAFATPAQFTSGKARRGIGRDNANFSVISDATDGRIVQLGIEFTC